MGWATVHSRRVITYIQDPEVGEIDEGTAADICDGMDLAASAGVPLIGILGHSDMARRETVHGLAAYGRVLDRQVRCSGVIPQITVLTGHIAGGWSQVTSLSDLNICVEGAATMWMNDPGTTATVTAETVDPDQLGGASTLASRSALVHLVSSGVDDSLAITRYVLSFVPDNNLTSPPYYPPNDDPSRTCDELEHVIPDSSNVPYDVRDVIHSVADDGEFLELQENYARNIVVGLARLDGYTIGLVCSQPLALAGTLDIESSVKGARFVQFCDSYNIPLLTLVDTPGFRPGVQEEFRGIIRHGAKLVFAYAQATVPRITLILRKAYGGAYIVMNSRHIRADLSFAWPSAEIAVMGAQGATKIIHRREIAQAEDPAAQEALLTDQYRETFANPFQAAERGYVDDVIRPVDTRRRLIRAFDMLRSKREVLPSKKHGNGPL